MSIEKIRLLSSRFHKKKKTIKNYLINCLATFIYKVLVLCREQVSDSCKYVGKMIILIETDFIYSADQEVLWLF